MGGWSRSGLTRSGSPRVSGYAAPPPTPQPAGEGAQAHRPRMLPEEVRLIREWHEAWYAHLAEEGREDRVVDHLGLRLHVPVGVAAIAPVAHLLGDLVLAESRPGLSVLDLGCGCGANALLAASRGAEVVAVDVNPAAVAATRENAERHGLADLVQARLSDGFDAVPERFDLIVADPPLRWFPARDALEAAATDEDYRLLRRIVAQARDHLTPAGRMLFFFSSSGDLRYLRELFAVHDYETEVVALGRLFRLGQGFDYLTYRVFA